jgi:signal transduction histidine kinase/ActR/RegA family two-component response regulator
MMPGVDGYAFLEQAQYILTGRPFTPILIWSADLSPSSKTKALALGASDFLIKPVDPVEIQLKVANFLRIRNMQLEIERNREQLEERVKERTEELTALNEELLTARDEALLASRVKGQFLANINHELRTPLTGVIGLTNMLIAKQLDPDDRRILDTIANCASDFLTVLDGILDLSELEGSTFITRREPIELNLIIQNAIAKFQPIGQKRGIRVEESIPAETPPTVLADDVTLSKVLEHVLSNGVKFTQNGSVRLIFSYIMSHEKLRAKFDIQDTGIGIAADQVGHIFESFTQLEAASNRRYGGAGLGLTLAKRYVEQMSGSISVESEIGKGTTVTIELEFDVAEGPQKSVKANINSGSNPFNLRVLVVEDNELNLFVATELLKDCRCEVTAAVNGLEAVELVADQEFDLVLMDLQMPICDGFEATRIIRERERALALQNVPIYALTANATNNDRAACLEVGMLDLLPKPITTERIKQVIATVAGESIK